MDTALQVTGITCTTQQRARWAHNALIAALVVGPFMLQGYSFLRFGRTIRLVDEYFYHTHARSWYFDHDCDYENDLLIAPGFGTAAHYVDMRTPTGRVANNFPTGTALISFPLIALADVLTIVHNALAASPLPRDGYSSYYQFIVAAGHTLVGVAGLLACYVLCARFFAPHLAALAVYCVWLGTSALYYVGYESAQSHAASLAMVAFMLLIVDTIRREGFTMRRLVALGACCGMMVVTRPQDLVWAVVPAIVLIPRIIRGVAPVSNRCLELETHLDRREGRNWCGIGFQPAWGRHVSLIALAVVVAVACYVPQAIVNYKLFSTPVFNTYGNIGKEGEGGRLHWTSPDFTSALIDPCVGLLWTAPVAVLSMIGIGGMLFRRSLLLRAVAVGFGLTYYVIACISWVITGYGHRYFVSCTAAFALGLCVVFAWSSRRRWRTAVVGICVTIFLLWQVALFVSVNSGYRKATEVSPLMALWS